MKEKRICERIDFPNVNGSVELMETIKPITILNASEEGVCVSGADFPVGTVVRLEVDSPEEAPNISLYCKVVWTSKKKGQVKKSGLLFLNTNKILFRKDLITFVKMVDSARRQTAS
ncbi:MAG TPA: PilZ domain-containing protein [Deltaproteobacteria bacterium]|nr:PilZ domain-containing protein [Deltaproteobacteria bacterium]HOI06418.1 PilZ domain-containing protein [Deltaproteobacteria bacterium]